MGRYIIKRLLWMIPIILCVAILVFTLMTFCPGDPAAIVLGSSATEEDMNLMRESLGLNRPFLVRLGTYLRDAFLRFDLGRSYLTKVSIADSIREYLPRTMLLTIITMLISVGLALPLGIAAATHQGRWQDTVCMVFALIGISVPSFWLALLLILEFSVKHAWLPAMGIGGLKYYILPAISGSLGGVASLARQTRSSMLDVIRADYITTARAKGVSERNVITRHALKNALIPIITVIGTQFGRQLGGTMVIETIFGIPGMGQFIITGVNQRDYPVVQSGAIFLAIVFSLCMLGVDLLYAAADPRIKAQYAKGKRRAKK